MNKKRISLLLLVLVFAISVFAACGKGGSGNDAIVGTWKVSKLEVSGVSMDLEEYSKQMGQDIEVTMEFKANGKVTLNAMGEEETADYSLSGSKLIIDGDTATYDGKEIVYSEPTSGMKMTLVKA